MEDRKELSEILLGNKKTTTDGKKSVFVVIAALVIFGIAAFAVWKFLGAKQERLALQSPTEVIDPGAMKPLDLNSSDFGNDLSGFDTLGSNEPSPFDMNNFGNTAQDNKNNDIDNVIRNIAPPAPSQPQPRQPQATPQQPQVQPQPRPAPTPAPAPRQATAQPSASIAPDASKNGSAPTRGFYWQLGSFANQPAPEFLALVKKYSYRIQRAQKDQTTISRYLLGPYNSRGEAPAREDVARIFKENPMPVEIP